MSSLSVDGLMPFLLLRSHGAENAATAFLRFSALQGGQSPRSTRKVTRAACRHRWSRDAAGQDFVDALPEPSSELAATEPLVKESHDGFEKNLREQPTLCRAIVDHAQAPFIASNTVLTTCL